MTDQKPFSLVKPTIKTPFHIDFAWWKENDNNWRVLLHSCLCPEHQITFSNLEEEVKIDFIDPETGEISAIDGLQQILITHCCKQPEFVSGNHAVVDSVFRVLLSHGNEPMTMEQIGSILDRSPDTILRLLSGPRVFMGIRPCHS
jgi:hypothetical protein